MNNLFITPPLNRDWIHTKANFEEDLGRLRSTMPLEDALEEGLRKSLRWRFKERRGKLEIIADILSVTQKRAKKTEIVYKANINFTRVEKYLPYLMELGLIKQIDGEYLITEKGREFLRDYENVKEQLVT